MCAMLKNSQAVQTNEQANPTKTSTEAKVFEYGDLIVSHLSRLGVEYVFGVPGGGIEPLYNALARSERQGNTRSVVAKHETGAAFMANGYARATGKLGVCCGTTGPGATNLITGVSCASTDGIPLLVITGQTALPTFNKGAAQESSCTGIDTVDMFKSCTRYSTLVSHPDQLEDKLLTAISHAFSNTPGPVHLSIPLDILRAPVEQKVSKQILQPMLDQEVWPNPNTVDVLKMTLNNIDNAVILLGQDSEGAVKEIIQFAEQRNWSIVTTPMGKGLISSYHPLYEGVFGLAGHEAAFAALEPGAAQLVIAVGTALDECATSGWNELIMSSRLVHIDSNPEHLTRSPMACMRVLGSPKRVFEQLIEPDQQSMVKHITPAHGAFPSYLDDASKAECVKSDEPIKPAALFWQMSQKCPANTQVTLDIGNSFLWGIHYWQNRNSETESKSLFHISIGFGSMGFALGSSVGLAMGQPKKPVVAFTGDGSWLMNGQEFITAAQENLNIIYVVLNDSSLGTVKHGQRLAGAEKTSFKLPTMNFADIAKAMGLRSYRIETSAELAALDIDAILAEGGPVILDVVIDPEEVPPLGQRMKMLGTAQEESKKSPVAHNDIAINDTAPEQDIINSMIWEEEAADDNPFAPAACYAHGYDVYGDLMNKVSLTDYLYLLFKGDLPNQSHQIILNKLAIALADLGPREPSILAAMNAGVGGSTWSSALTAALAAGSGQFGGSHELHHIMDLWDKNGTSLEAWKTALNEENLHEEKDIFPEMEHMPGFDPHGVSCPKPIKQLLAGVAQINPKGPTAWLTNNLKALEDHVGYPLAMVGAAGTIMFELGLDADQAELLFLLLRLPGAAVHAHEQHELGYQQFPFYHDGLELTNDPANDENIDDKENS